METSSSLTPHRWKRQALRPDRLCEPPNRTRMLGRGIARHISVVIFMWSHHDQLKIPEAGCRDRQFVVKITQNILYLKDVYLFRIVDQGRQRGGITRGRTAKLCACQVG